MPEDHRTQNIAIILIAVALGAIAAGEHFHYAQLTGFALAVGGAGLGVLTGQKMQQVTTKGGGNIVNPPADSTNQEGA